MGLGILIGAWVYRKFGESMVWVAAIFGTTLSLIDAMWGREIGRAAGAAVKEFWDKL